MIAWLHVHRELTLGFFLGCSVELAVVLLGRWTWDRIQWVRWFSRMG